MSQGQNVEDMPHKLLCPYSHLQPPYQVCQTRSACIPNTKAAQPIEKVQSACDNKEVIKHWLLNWP